MTEQPARTPPRTKAPESGEPAPKRAARPAAVTEPVGVVGIGASAGGFEATQQLVSKLPPETGLAFILVAHLDPRHESQLAEIVSRMTKVPVVEAEEGARIGPDRIYVIPPNTHLQLRDNVLHLQPREAGAGHMHVIDRFLRTLAEDRGPESVAVILSGSLSDGTQGAREVRAVGGLVFVQDPETARYAEMPRSVIAAGAADVVMAPEGIAAELARLPEILARARAATDGAGPSGAFDQSELQSVLRLVRLRTGVDFTHYKRSTILRRLQRRMVARRVEDLAAYVRLLESDAAEARALQEELLIHVTRFFREPETYEALRTRVLPQLVENRAPNQPLRFWIPGCSTGEEAYSMAMLVTEFMVERDLNLPVQIFATDISDKAIRAAREGYFPESIAEDVSRERLLRYFERSDGGYRVSKTLRGMCVFAVHDLASDAPFSNMDIISCRNVLVYMDAPLQRRVLANLHYGLRPRGFLVLGGSESVGRSEELFEALDSERRLWVRRPVSPPALYQVPREHVYPRVPGESASQPAVWTEAELLREADRALVERLSPAGVVINDALEVVSFRGDTRGLLHHRPGTASLNLLRMAPDALAVELRSAVQECRASGAPVRRTGVGIDTGSGVLPHTLEVLPLTGPSPSERYYLLLFIAETRGSRRERSALRPLGQAMVRLLSGAAAREREAQLEHLQRETEAVRERLRQVSDDYEATTEELRSANEEAVSGNEELQSTVEELETTKEELQSTNEELTTLNQELQDRNQELTRLNSDLVNLLNSVDLPIVMLGADLRIRRFTPRAGALLNLIPTDVGRPITDLRLPFAGEHQLRSELMTVMESMRAREVEVHDPEGEWSVLGIHPYRGAEGRVEGCVLVLLPITRVEARSPAVQRAYEQAQALADAVWDPVVVLDSDMNLRAANRHFFDRFGTSEDILGTPILELSSAAWDTVALRRLLLDLPAKGQVRAQRVHGSQGEDYMVNARILRTAGEPVMVILALRRVEPRT